MSSPSLQTIWQMILNLEAAVARQASGGGVTSVTGTAPITSTLGTTPAIGITAATTLAAGSMSAADKVKLNTIIAAKNGGVALAGGPWTTVNAQGALVATDGGGGVLNLNAVPGAGATQYTFVLQPGGAPGGNVYTTWAALYAAMSIVSGPKTVQVDTSLGAAHMTAAGPAYNLHEVTFVPATAAVSGPLVTELVIDDGATIAPGTVHFLDGLVVTYAGAVGPCMQVGAGPNNEVPIIDVGYAATLRCSGAGLFVSVPDTATAFLLVHNNARLGDGVHGVGGGAAPGSNLFTVATSHASIQTGALTIDTYLQYDDTATLGTFDISVHLVQLSQAGLAQYQPNNAGNQIQSIGAALDALGNHAAADAPGTGQLPASPTFEPVASILNFVMTPHGSGKLHVEIAGIFVNTDGAVHHVTPGIAIVVHGAPAPHASDFSPWSYDLGAVGATLPSTEPFTLLVDYGGGGSFPAALVPGTAYDIYAMAAADAGAVVSVPGGAVQLTVQEQL